MNTHEEQAKQIVDDWNHNHHKMIKVITAALDQAAQEANRLKDIMAYIADCQPDGKKYLDEAHALGADYCEEQRQEREDLREELAQLHASQPVWGDKPTVAGWYWWQFTADSRSVVFDLTEKNGVLYRRDDSGKLWELPEDGEWAGPLPLPKEATCQK